MSYVDEEINVLTILGSAPVLVEPLSHDVSNSNFDIYVVRYCPEVYDGHLGHGFSPWDQLLPLFDAGKFASFIFYNYLTCRLERRSIESAHRITNELASWKELLFGYFSRPTTMLSWKIYAVLSSTLTESKYYAEHEPTGTSGTGQRRPPGGRLDLKNLAVFPAAYGRGGVLS